MADFEFPAIPPALPGAKTYTYKQIDNRSILADVYLPSVEADELDRKAGHPVLLFIHGGGWIGGHRQEYCRPLFEECLAHHFVVVTADYRLVPESSFVHGQLEDIRDVGAWIRKDLSVMLEHEVGVRVDGGRIVVAGASAGALLALLTPKLWTLSPSAIISIYGPTDMHHLPYRAKGPLAGLEVPTPDSQTIQSATNFDMPPSNTPLPSGIGKWLNDRTKLGLHMFRTEATADLLLRGLTKSKSAGEGYEYSFPQVGQVTEAEIDEISPLQLCRKLTFPPTYQIMGSEDSVFEVDHVTRLAAALEEQKVPHQEHVVVGADHAFDMAASSGGEHHLNVIKPAVAWVRRFV